MDTEKLMAEIGLVDYEQYKTLQDSLTFEDFNKTKEEIKKIPPLHFFACPRKIKNEFTDELILSMTPLQLVYLPLSTYIYDLKIDTIKQLYEKYSHETEETYRLVVNFKHEFEIKAQPAIAETLKEMLENEEKMQEMESLIPVTNRISEYAIRRKLSISGKLFKSLVRSGVIVKADKPNEYDYQSVLNYLSDNVCRAEHDKRNSITELPQLYSINELAQIVDISVDIITSRCRNKKLTFFDLGGTKVSVDDFRLCEYLNQHKKISQSNTTMTII